MINVVVGIIYYYYLPQFILSPGGGIVFNKSLTIFLLSCFLSPSTGLAARLKEKCFVYAYETLLNILPDSLPSANVKERAFNMAGDSCRRESNEGCLSYAYHRLLSFYEETPENRFKAWGEAVNACRYKVDSQCLQYAESYWNNTEKLRDSYKAFQNSVVSCDSEVKGDCLSYVFENERKRGRSETAAFNSGVTVCRGGVEKACLETLYEKIYPDALPTARRPWENSIAVCQRN